MPKRNETLKFSVGFRGSERASATTTIVDISYPSTHSTRWSSNAQGSDTILETDEGKDIYFIINTDNVADGTKLVVMITSGVAADGVTASDFVNYQYRQDVTIYGNSAVVKVSIAADQLTENREQFYGALLDQAGTVLSTSWMYINDTSKTPPPGYSAGWFSSSAGTNPITSINEGSTAWLVVRTTNVPNGTTLSLRPDAGISRDDFTDNVLDREVVIQNNIGRVSYPIKADNMAEGNETFTVHVYTLDAFYESKASATITVNDTSRETVIVIPDEYHLKGVILLPLFQRIMGRSPNPDERIRVVVPSHIELNAFPRVVGREFLRMEKTDIYWEGMGWVHKPVYNDTIWPAQHGIDLVGMPDSRLVTVDVYGKVVGGQLTFVHSNTAWQVADWTFNPVGLPMNYYAKHSSGYTHDLIVGNSSSGGYWDLFGVSDPPNPSFMAEAYGIYAIDGFNLIVRNGAVVTGHGGTVKTVLGVETTFIIDWTNPNDTGKFVPVTDFSVYGGGYSAVSCKNATGTIRLNVIGNGIFAGGGAAGGCGGGLLNMGSTHWDLGLSPFYGAYSGGGAPYGGCGYTFYGWSGDPVCPVRYARTQTWTPGRRLGDTGSQGYYSKLSGGSATFWEGGAVAGRQWFGPNGKGYQWEYEPGRGGGIGQHGNWGDCPLYIGYYWNSGKKVYTQEERISASAPGRAGAAASWNTVVNDPNLA